MEYKIIILNLMKDKIISQKKTYNLKTLEDRPYKNSS
jgi:hypothetical protein